MRKLTKQHIINQISESSKYIDEMAYTPAQSQIYGRDEKKPQDYHYDKPEIPFEKGDLDAEDYEVYKMRHTFQPDPKLTADEKKAQNMIEDYIVIQLEEGGPRHVVVPKFRKNGEILDENRFKEENPELYDYLMKVTEGKIHFIEMNQVANNPFLLKTSKGEVRRNKVREKAEKELGIKFPEPKPRETKEQEIVLRNLINPTFRYVEEKVNGHLKNAGLPGLVMPKHNVFTQKKYVDTYAEINSNSIKWNATHIRVYETMDEYIQHSKDLVRNRESKIIPGETHQPRNNNPGSRWSPLRKTVKKDDNYKENPYTDKYKLPRSGYSEKDNDIVIKSEFVVKGQRIMGVNDQPYFKWRFEFNTYFGKKLKEDNEADELELDISLSSVSRSGNVMNISLTDLIKDQNFTNSFNEGTTGLIEQILAIDTKEVLRSRYKNIDKLDITKVVQEMAIDKIVKNVIAELNI